MVSERIARRALIIIALLGLAAGAVAYATGQAVLAHWIWALATVPVVVTLAASMTRDLLYGRMGVDAIAFLSMTAALALGQSLAGIVVAIMYAGGTVLEDFAVARAERNLRSLVDRAPRFAHRRTGQTVEDIPIDKVMNGDALVIRAGEIIPVDGLIISPHVVIDESAVTGEPIPVTRQGGEIVRSGTLNAGETFSISAAATANESTYAGILRLVAAAQTAKAPFIRLADRYALLFLPATILVVSAAWYLRVTPSEDLPCWLLQLHAPSF